MEGKEEYLRLVVAKLKKLRNHKVCKLEPLKRQKDGKLITKLQGIFNFMLGIVSYKFCNNPECISQCYILISFSVCFGTFRQVTCFEGIKCPKINRCNS
ncbi:hypothetical protein SDJN02_05798 [Cucurbita argyrosperma subsp. argyrosperma]|nr:hypothetical protein SDJN02_05798 [Cucurbita argyrosperma subsp. argyrosperma]